MALATAIYWGNDESTRLKPAGQVFWCCHLKDMHHKKQLTTNISKHIKTLTPSAAGISRRLPLCSLPNTVCRGIASDRSGGSPAVLIWCMEHDAAYITIPYVIDATRRGWDIQSNNNVWYIYVYIIFLYIYIYYIIYIYIHTCVCVCVKAPY